MAVFSDKQQMYFRMNKLILSIVLLFMFSINLMAQVPDKAKILKIAEEKYGITPDNANITDAELIAELNKRGVNLSDMNAVETAAVEIIRERQATAIPAPVEDVKAKIEEESKAKEQLANAKEEIVKEAATVVAEEKATTEPIKVQKEAPNAAVAGENIRVYGQDLPSSISLQIDPKNINPKETYIIGTGDAFGVNIFGPRYASFQLIVNDDGYVSIPEIPGSRMYVRGLTYGKAKKVIRGTVARIFDLDVAFLEITLNYARTVTVHIMGEVNVKGSQVLTGANTAFNALAATKGLTDIASVRNIKLVRVGKGEKIVDIYKYLMTPAYGEDFYLEDNDYIIVPPIGRVVEIKGEVKRPHKYELISGEELKQLVEYAAGTTSKAYTKNIKITRIAGNKQTMLNVDLQSVLDGGQDFKLLDGDIIEIGLINGENKDVVELSGAFLYPGTYALEQGKKLSYYLTKGELKEEARTDTAYVLRKYADGSSSYLKLSIDNALNNPSSADNIELQPLDIINIGLQRDFERFDKVTLSGEINKGEVVQSFDSSLTVRDLIFLGAGLKPNYADKAVLLRTSLKDGTKRYISFSIKDVMDKNSNFNQQFKLAPLDEIKVYNTEEIKEKYSISVSGEVRKPNSFAYDEDLTLKDLLYQSGGLKPTASNKIVIERTNINTSQKEYTDVDLDALLQEGSTLNESIKLLPKDNIRVLSPVIEGEYTVSIQGEIYKPGGIIWGPGLKLGDVIRISGGFKPEAANSRLEVSRVTYNNGSEINEVVVAYFDIGANRQLTSGQDFELERYDKVTVRIAPEFKLQQNIRIEGEVKFPGTYPLLGKNERIFSVVGRAGGLSQEAFPEGATLRRTEDGVGVILLDLNDVLDKKDGSVYNYILREGDVIVIPKATDLISLSGAVDHPTILTAGSINVPFHKRRRAGYYVNRYAQGVDRDREGRRKYITVTYPNGDVRETLNLGIAMITPKVKQGSKIAVGTVPPKPVKEGEKEKEPVDWGDVVESTVTKITGVLTLMVLLQQAFK